MDEHHAAASFSTINCRKSAPNTASETTEVFSWVTTGGINDRLQAVRFRPKTLLLSVFGALSVKVYLQAVVTQKASNTTARSVAPLASLCRSYLSLSLKSFQETSAECVSVSSEKALSKAVDGLLTSRPHFIPIFRSLFSSGAASHN